MMWYRSWEERVYISSNLMVPSECDSSRRTYTEKSAFQLLRAREKKSTSSFKKEGEHKFKVKYHETSMSGHLSRPPKVSCVPIVGDLDHSEGVLRAPFRLSDGIFWTASPPTQTPCGHGQSKKVSRFQYKVMEWKR